MRIQWMIAACVVGAMLAVAVVTSSVRGVSEAMGRVIAAADIVEPRTPEMQQAERVQQDADRRAAIVTLCEEVIATVEREFYNQAVLADPEWEAAKAELRAAAAEGHHSISWNRYVYWIQDALRSLGASHTAYYTDRDRAWYDILDIFSSSTDPAIGALIDSRFTKAEGDRVHAWSNGALTRNMGPGRAVITDVIPGSHAAEAGLRPGDSCSDIFNKGAYWSAYMGLSMTPGRGWWRTNGIDDTRFETEYVNPAEEFLGYMTTSVRVIERDGARLGYIRIYSWAGQHYQDRLEELLQQEPLASADGVVLDIRGGWGGANPQYLDLFDAPMPTLTHMPREGEAFEWDPAQDLPERTFYWRNPVVLLVDGGTRSGKEIVAYAFKKHGIGPVVGERTAGAVLAGRPFVLSDDSLLYLAVADVLVDGERLEGVGVTPDLIVWGEGSGESADPQKDAAFDALLEEIQQRD